nr:hypothetical protein [Cellulomonas sp. KRMCY2]
MDPARWISPAKGPNPGIELGSDPTSSPIIAASAGTGIGQSKTLTFPNATSA